jgi:hypothetical protein
MIVSRVVDKLYSALSNCNNRSDKMATNAKNDTNVHPGVTGHPACPDNLT